MKAEKIIYIPLNYLLLLNYLILLKMQLRTLPICYLIQNVL